MRIKGLIAALLTLLYVGSTAQELSLESVTSYPFPSDLTAAASGSRIAVALNEKGARNIYVAEGPGFELRKLTRFDKDEGLEISSVKLSPDGKWVVFVRGGDNGAFDETIPRNPASSPVQPAVQVMSIPFAGGDPILIDEGTEPVISPSSDKIGYLKNGALWESAIDGRYKPRRAFFVRGRVSQFSWSPDGRQLLFVSNRRDHSFIGIYRDSTQPIQWIAPAVARDVYPRWSPDGKKIVYIRRNALGGKPDSITVRRHQPWSIMVADPASGEAKKIWTAPKTLRGSFPGTQGGPNLHWAAGNRIIFVSFMDGWPHIYSMDANGGEPLLLTKGDYGLEHIRLSPDKKWILAAANTGPDTADLHRRHLVKIPVDRASVELLTPGAGIETFPAITGDQKHIAFISATAQRPGLVAVMPFAGGPVKLVGASRLPGDFPVNKMVIPKPVRFKASDGKWVYAQLFEPVGVKGKKPAVVFIHGGPQRQMVLGWHYGDYYSNTYALNQYLAGRGFVVLSVNYRLGIGYGYEFQYPANWGSYGASEYLDIKAAGEWLAQQTFVDANRIGTYGGSYGGYLVALALGRDSHLFKAGVDIHGVHTNEEDYPPLDGEQAPDAAYTREVIWKSSPVAWVETWTSPVLFIHGDDDGNVPFSETVDLVKRFEQLGKPYESLVIPDETHHWMRYHNQVRVDRAIAEFLERKLMGR
ncbi:MAG TPA: prolyl oligopeptidase family serine peptidase [Flavihumibacter sp.]